MVFSCADMYVRPGASVPASCVPCVPTAQGSLPRGATHCTHAVRVPDPCGPCVPWHPRFSVACPNPNPNSYPNPYPIPTPTPNQARAWREMRSEGRGTLCSR